MARRLCVIVGEVREDVYFKKALGSVRKESI